MESLAEVLDVSKQAVKEWEAGRRQPTIDNLKALAKVLGKPPGWFFEEESNEVLPEPRETENKPPTEIALLQLFARQQDIVTEQQAMMERQRQDVAHLTDLLAKQQEHFFWQQRQVASQTEKQQALIDALTAKVHSLEEQILTQSRAPSRGRHQLLEPPAIPGRAGEG